MSPVHSLMAVARTRFAYCCAVASSVADSISGAIFAVIKACRIKNTVAPSIALALLTALAPTIGDATIPASERAALVAIYDNTNGASWRASTDWKGVVGTECTWYGVVCSTGNLNVTELRLNANNLVGVLPASLNQLTQLAFLFASRNTLSGSIPALTGLAKLEDIELNENQLTGPIPSLQGLVSLRLVFLDRNQLSGSIPALNALANLERFSVDTNKLTGSIPPLLGLKKLDLLTLSNNLLTGPIPPLTDLSALQRFNVYSNQLSGDVPAVPSPTSLLFADASQLCPNALTPSVNVAWDTASRVKPWSNGCVAAVLTAQIINFTPSNPVTITPSPSGTAATLSATGGGSGNPIVFASSSPPTVCTVNGTTVTYFGAGNCVITADQAGNATYSAAPQVTAIVVVQIVGLLPQVITNFAPASPVTLNIAPTPTTATLTATGGGSTSPIVFSTSSASSICTVTGDVVTYIGVGTCRLNADQGNDATYSAAPTVSVNVTVQLIPQVILGFNPATPVTVGTAPATLTALEGASGIPAVYATTSPASICTVSGTTLTYVGVGTCVVTANRAGDVNFSAAPEVSVSILIRSAALLDQAITGFAPASPVTLGTAPATLTAAGGASGQPIVFATTSLPTVCTVAGSVVTYIGAGTCVVTANQAGSATYNAAPTVSASIVIQAGVVIVNVTPSTGTANGSISPFNVQAVATGSQSVFTLTPDAGFVVAGVSGTCGGTLLGNTFTTNPITAACTVIAAFAAAPVQGEAVAVPTLSQWALLWLGLIAAGLGALGLRYRQS
jgi:hypothetical protein